MSLEVRFKVENLGVSVKNAGYLMMDSVRNVLQEGFTDIAEDGSVLIPIESKWVEEGEGMRVTIDDFDGSNFMDSGSATDVVEVTLAYVDYSVSQDGIYVTCVTKTLENNSWDMGDGTFIDGDVFTYFYKSNGTFTIKSGSFTQTVVITGVTQFSVTLFENIITCTPQTGVDGKWNFGDGETEKTGVVDYEITKNGSYLISHGGYSTIIDLNYFSEGLIQSVLHNTVNFNGLLVTDEINYGDGRSGYELTHVYPNHGRFLVKSGDKKSYVEIQEYKIPTASFSISLDPNNSSLVTFTGKGGDTYQSLINGVEFDTLNSTYQFPESGYYPYVLNATLVNGNSNQLVETVKVLENNTLPIVSFETVINELEVSFTSVVVDDDFEASHLYEWTYNKGEKYELKDYADPNPVHLYQNPVIPNDPQGQTFTVELKVTDNVGAVAIASKEITVYDFS